MNPKTRLSLQLKFLFPVLVSLALLAGGVLALIQAGDSHPAFLLAVGELVLTISALLVWFFAHRLSRQLTELREGVDAVAQGDFSKKLEVGSQDEAAELAAAFNEMTRNVRASQEELQKKYDILKAKHQQMVQTEKLTGIGEFVAGVAHELNNPLTSVMGFSELLQQSELQEQQRRYLEVVFKSAKRCQKVVQSLLSFARRHAPERKMVSVNDIITAALEISEAQLREANIETVTQFDPKLPATELDPHQMQQVFLNIITNARQAMEGRSTKGRLRIATESLDGRVRIAVEDNGPGIAPENVNRIFNPFFTTKEVGKAMGLGLSLCYGIVSEHGGTIAVQGTQGEGATFVIELPVAQSAPLEMSGAAPEIPALHEGVGKRVLVVDDEDMILQMIRQVLISNGYKVDIAHDGESALRRMNQYHYDLALCDWRMPGLTGEQVCERLEASNPAMSRRLIFITGQETNDKVQEFLRAHDKVCLSKPFTLVQFNAAISKVLDDN